MTMMTVAMAVATINVCVSSQAVRLPEMQLEKESDCTTKVNKKTKIF